MTFRQFIECTFILKLVRDMIITQNLHIRLSCNPVLEAIMKYRYDASINITRHYSQRFLSFDLSVFDKNTVLKDIRKLSVKKVI